MIALVILALAAGLQTTMANGPVPSYADHLRQQHLIAYDR